MTSTVSIEARRSPAPEPAAVRHARAVLRHIEPCRRVGRLHLGDHVPQVRCVGRRRCVEIRFARMPHDSVDRKALGAQLRQALGQHATQAQRMAQRVVHERPDAASNAVRPKRRAGGSVAPTVDRLDGAVSPV